MTVAYAYFRKTGAAVDMGKCCVWLRQCIVLCVSGVISYSVCSGAFCVESLDARFVNKRIGNRSSIGATVDGNSHVVTDCRKGEFVQQLGYF